MSQIKCQKCQSKFEAKSSSGLTDDVYSGSLSSICPYCGYNNAQSSPSQSEAVTPQSSPSQSVVPVASQHSQGSSEPPQGGGGSGGGSSQELYKKPIPFFAERKNRFFGSYIDTIRLLTMRPIEFFKNHQLTQDMGGLMLFSYLSNFINTIAVLIMYVLIFFGLQYMLPAQDVPPEFFHFVNNAGPMLIVMGIIMLFVAPLLNVLFTFIYSGIHHLMLITVGGSKKPFLATANVYFLFSFISVISAPIVILTLIPLVGSLINLAFFVFVLLYYVFYIIVGMAEAHQISGGMSFLSWFLMILLCCCLCLLPFFIFGNLIQGFMEGAMSV